MPQQLPQIKMPSSPITTLILVGAGAAGIYFGYKFIKGKMDDEATAEQDKTILSDPNVQQALILRQGVNPSGHSWLMAVDGVKTDVILDTAKKITNLPAVEAAYAKQYPGSVLMDDLTEKLSADNMNEFLSITKTSGVLNDPEVAKFSGPKNNFSVGDTVINSTKGNISYYSAYKPNPKKASFKAVPPGGTVGTIVTMIQFRRLSSKDKKTVVAVEYWHEVNVDGQSGATAWVKDSEVTIKPKGGLLPVL